MRMGFFAVVREVGRHRRGAAAVATAMEAAAEMTVKAGRPVPAEGPTQALMQEPARVPMRVPMKARCLALSRT